MYVYTFRTFVTGTLDMRMTVDTAFRIDRLEVSVFRYPLRQPVATSFGIMKNRPAVFVRLQARDGAFGWGEIFANWPAAGAEHRARLLVEDVADLLLGQDFESPAEAFFHIEAATHIRALQCGEFGPFSQVIAGLDIALHDLVARRAGLPVRRLLNPDASDLVPAYASGIHIDAAAEMIQASRDRGFSRFKLKIGFDLDEDVRKLREIAEQLEPRETLMADANQAYDLPQALSFVDQAADIGLAWLEEPISADAPNDHWAKLADTSTIPLAGGENIAGITDFETAIASRHLGFLQPDIAKWGGFTGCFAVAERLTGADTIYCPHFLGGGVGLTASAHLLAAVGGKGWLEVDVNPNPLRDLAGDLDGFVSGAGFKPTSGAGLAMDDPTLPVAIYETLHFSVGRDERPEATGTQFKLRTH